MVVSWLLESCRYGAASAIISNSEMGNSLICFVTGLSIQGVPECRVVTAAVQSRGRCRSALQQLSVLLPRLNFCTTGVGNQGSDYKQNDVQSKLCHLKHICFLSEPADVFSSCGSQMKFRARKKILVLLLISSFGQLIILPDLWKTVVTALSKGQHQPFWFIQVYPALVSGFPPFLSLVPSSPPLTPLICVQSVFLNMCVHEYMCIHEKDTFMCPFFKKYK